MIYYSTIYYSIVCYSITYYSIMHHSTIYYSTRYHCTIWNSTMFYSTKYCSTIYCSIIFIPLHIILLYIIRLCIICSYYTTKCWPLGPTGYGYPHLYGYTLWGMRAQKDGAGYGTRNKIPYQEEGRPSRYNSKRNTASISLLRYTSTFPSHSSIREFTQGKQSTLPMGRFAGITSSTLGKLSGAKTARPKHHKRALVPPTTPYSYYSVFSTG